MIWIMQFVKHKLDRDQFGGVKGHSIAHYLIEVTNTILFNQDLEDPVSTLFGAVNISKGFNKIDHSKALTRLSDLGCPGWLLRIVMSYMTSRSLKIRGKDGLVSESKPLPGGAGQGTILGLFLFCVMFNEAGPKENKLPIGKTITQPTRQRKAIQVSKCKWIDDLSITAATNLRTDLVPDTRVNQPPAVPQKDRTKATRGQKFTTDRTN